MMHTDLGTMLNNTWANTNMQNITIKEKIPSYIFDKSQIAIAAWVQEDKKGFINATDLGTLPGGGQAYDTAYSRSMSSAFSPGKSDIRCVHCYCCSLSIRVIV